MKKGKRGRKKKKGINRLLTTGRKFSRGVQKKEKRTFLTKKGGSRSSGEKGGQKEKKKKKFLPELKKKEEGPGGIGSAKRGGGSLPWEEREEAPITGIRGRKKNCLLRKKRAGRLRARMRTGGEGSRNKREADLYRGKGDFLKIERGMSVSSVQQKTKAKRGKRKMVFRNCEGGWVAARNCAQKEVWTRFLHAKERGQGKKERERRKALNN